ncbi:hypothetical protein FRC12_011556 [Ceratobasidium sp. 428]|nr:hypothetical protein FRC12_011556 [Ceratobasidium sp. 428]
MPGVVGHHGVDARNFSPGRLAEVVTVAASDVGDFFCEFSNYGPAVDIIAPGERILSAGIANEMDIVEKSGTSFATAHATGIIAKILGHRHFSPKQTVRLLQFMSARGKLKNLRRDTW